MSLPGSVPDSQTDARHGQATRGHSPIANTTPDSSAAALHAIAPQLEQHRSRRKAAAPKRCTT